MSRFPIRLCSPRAARRLLGALLCAASASVAIAAGTATVQHAGPLLASPDPAARRVLQLHRLSTVQVLETRRDWVLVEADGNRQGWVPENALSFDTTPPASPGAASAPARLPLNDAALRPRASLRTANHALIVGAASPDAIAISRLLGVPDGNVASLPDPRDASPAPTLERRLQAIAPAPERPERVFIYASGTAERQTSQGACTDNLILPGGQRIPIDELSRAASALARRADHVFVVIDSDLASTCKRTPEFAAPGNLLYIGNLGPERPAAAETHHGPLTDALLACLDGRAPRGAATGLASGAELARCAKTFANAKMAERSVALPISTGGTPSQIPALLPQPATRAASPAELLRVLHGQRSPQRTLDVQRRPARGAIQLAVKIPRPGHLYVLAATERGVTLLHPGSGTPDLPLETGTSLNLPARDADGKAWSQLLVLVADAPRNFLRAGFTRSGDFTSAPADARTLRDLPLEILGGDSDARCGASWPSPPRCSTTFGAALLTP